MAQRLIDANELKINVILPRCGAKTIIGDAIRKMIDSAPTIDAEPVRHGKWIFNPSDAIEAMFAKPKCSECGFESADGGNYCSECGARMDEE